MMFQLEFQRLHVTIREAAQALARLAPPAAHRCRRAPVLRGTRHYTLLALLLPPPPVLAESRRTPQCRVVLDEAVVGRD